MEKVYYSDSTDSAKAIKKAISIAFNHIAKDNELKSIILLFPSLTVADEFLSNVLPSLTKGDRICHIDKPSCGIIVETLRNYSPNSKHILIPVFVSEKDISKYEDEWNAKVWIIVSHDLNSMKRWLQVHEAESMETGVCMSLDMSLDQRVINGIEWLYATSYPNEGFNHPLDINRLKCMANALAINSVPLDYYSVLHYCLTHKINHNGGRKIAEHFVKAQTRKYKTDGKYPISFMTEMMNETHTRI